MKDTALHYRRKEKKQTWGILHLSWAAIPEMDRKEIMNSH